MVSRLNGSTAPHRPAGHFSPYSDGEKGLAATLASTFATLVIGETGYDSTPLPVTIRGGFRQAGEGSAGLGRLPKSHKVARRL
jgi:hypothetical protein